jgi:hypothetical protein
LNKRVGPGQWFTSGSASGAYIGQFEQAFRKPQLDISQRIDEVLQTDGIFERLCRKLIDDKRHADYFAQVVEFERTATRICEFAPTVVPGPAANGGVRGAVTIAANPFVTDECVEEIVAARRDGRRSSRTLQGPSTGWSSMRACCVSRWVSPRPWPSNWTPSRG